MIRAPIHRVQRILTITLIVKYDNFLMETRQLELFVAVAEELNFTRAANRLFATQSTVSAGIRALESELGATLFARSTRRVELTQAAERLLPQARAVLSGIDRLRSSASDSAAGLRGRVRVGILTNLETDYLADLFGTFHERYPLVDLSLSVSPTGSSGLADDVRRGRLDVAFTGFAPADLPGLTTHLLAKADFVVVMRDDDELAAKSTVSLGDVATRRQIDTPRGYGNRVLLDRAFSAKGMPRVVATELSDLTAVPRFVAAGLGIAIIPVAAPITVPGVAIRPLVDPKLTWTMTAISAADTSYSAAVAALLDLVGRDDRAGILS